MKQRTSILVLSLILGLLVQGVWAEDVQMNGSLGVSGAVNASSFTGGGSLLINLDPAKISSGTANISISGNATTATTADAVAPSGVSNTMLQNSSITVTPGNGLTGGGSVSLGGGTTLNINFAGNGSAGSASRSDHNHDAAYVQKSQLDCASGGRYEDNGDETISDCRTGLIWLKNANCTGTIGAITNTYGYLSWADANSWVAGIQNGKCGLTDGSATGDWRMPTKTELMAMVANAKKQGFTNPTLTNAAGTGPWTSGDAFTGLTQFSYYWSSTTYAFNTNLAWVIQLQDGAMGYFSKVAIQNYVWPVRGGQ